MEFIQAFFTYLVVKHICAKSIHGRVYLTENISFDFCESKAISNDNNSKNFLFNHFTILLYLAIFFTTSPLKNMTIAVHK